ncbi:MAG: alpha-amylase family glycosyl hydrolase, partial [Planctomycetota bacterium]
LMSKVNSFANWTDSYSKTLLTIMFYARTTHVTLARLCFVSITLLLSNAVIGQETNNTKVLQIERIDPPNWWADMKWNQVQVLVTGKNLGDVEVTCRNSNAIEVVKKHSENDRHLFVDLKILPTATPRSCTLTFTKEGTSVDVDWAIRKRKAGNRHLGFDQKDVVYLITPDRFANAKPENDGVEDLLGEFDPTEHGKRHGGDLSGIEQKLDYLKDLGITTLWLNPVLENCGVNSYHGYKTTDHYRIDPRFGTNEEYRSLVDSAHKRNIKVIFDHVSNHIGIRHPWISQLPTETWLNGSVSNHLLEKHYLHSIADVHADEETRRELKTFWFVDSMPDLNQQDPFVAKYLIQNTLWWIEYSGIDGIREDTWPYADDSFLHAW